MKIKIAFEAKHEEKRKKVIKTRLFNDEAYMKTQVSF